MKRTYGVMLSIVCGIQLPGAFAQSDFESQRQALVETLREQSKLAEEAGAVPISETTLAVLGTVPRHEFVPESQRPFAYRNRPLPIGDGQTISQPYIVALMTELADVDRDDRVLEIGTGSGYQAAVLAELADHVYTIEIIDRLGRRAAETLERLAYSNVSVRIGDGYAGWPEHAPFDAVVVTAAPEEIPQPLIDQLATGGRMVVPVGGQGEVQVLRLLVKESPDNVIVEDVIPVRFVPFTRDPAEE